VQVVAIAKKHGKSPAQVCIRLQVRRPATIIVFSPPAGSARSLGDPKESDPRAHRCLLSDDNDSHSSPQANLDVFDFELDEGDMAALLALNRNMRFSYSKKQLVCMSVRTISTEVWQPDGSWVPRDAHRKDYPFNIPF
jgi:hypothetical protein